MTSCEYGLGVEIAFFLWWSIAHLNKLVNAVLADAVPVIVRVLDVVLDVTRTFTHLYLELEIYLILFVSQIDLVLLHRNECSSLIIDANFIITPNENVALLVYRQYCPPVFNIRYVNDF